jgi:hypothetical protein
MRSFLIIILLSIITTSTSFAQRDKVEYLSNFDKAELHWGFYLGLNKNNYNISYKAPDAYPNAFVETEAKIGFNLGLIGDLRLHKNISLRLEPGLIANTKTLYFRHLGNEMDSVREASGTYLHIPLLIQFNANRLRNIRPYVVGGIAYDYNFASNFNNPDDNSSGEFRMQKNNFMYEIGIGMDFYFYYFKFSPSIRGIFAINNELKYDDDPNSPWTTPVDYFGTRGVFIRFTFQ